MSNEAIFVKDEKKLSAFAGILTSRRGMSVMNCRAAMTSSTFCKPKLVRLLKEISENIVISPAFTASSITTWAPKASSGSYLLIYLISRRSSGLILIPFEERNRFGSAKWTTKKSASLYEISKDFWKISLIFMKSWVISVTLHASLSFSESSYCSSPSCGLICRVKAFAQTFGSTSYSRVLKLVSGHICLIDKEKLIFKSPWIDISAIYGFGLEFSI